MRDSLPDDASLVALIAKAQTQAFDRFFDRYNRLVYSIAFAMLGDRALAEEATLDVFVQVWRRAATYRPEQGKVSTWLIAITRHHAIDILRWQKSRPDSQAVGWEDAALPNGYDIREAEDDLELSLRRERVQHALQQLPAEQRDVLLLAFFKGLSHSQIAEALGQPLGTIKSRIRLGMQRLRQLLEED